MTIKDVFTQIREWNQAYSIPAVTQPAVRLQSFQSILEEEVAEGLDLSPNSPFFKAELADWLGDMVVYCVSEAERWGIPLEPCIQIIMASNASKLGPDGRPIFDERGKVMKGPGYWRPEPKLAAFLASISSTTDITSSR